MEMIKPGEVAFGEPLIDSGLPVEKSMQTFIVDFFNVPSKLMSVQSNESIVVRPTFFTSRALLTAINHVNYAEYMNELFTLDKLGLRTPGISQAIEPAPWKGDDRVIVYDIANKIDGIDLNESLCFVPQDIAVNGFKVLMEYHRKALQGEAGLKLTDLSLRQLKYGIANALAEPELFLVDIDRYTWNPSVNPEAAIGSAINMANDINALESAYQINFPELRAQSADLVESILCKVGDKANTKERQWLCSMLQSYDEQIESGNFPCIAQYAFAK